VSGLTRAPDSDDTTVPMNLTKIVFK